MTSTMHTVGTFETSLKVVTVRSNGQQWEIDVDAKQRYGLPGCERVDTPTTKRLGTAGFDNVKQAERFIFDHLGFVPDIEGKSHYGIWDDSRHSDGERYGPPNQQVRLTTAQAAHAAANGGIVIKAHRNKLGKLTYRDTDTVRNNDGFDPNWRQDHWN